MTVTHYTFTALTGGGASAIDAVDGAGLTAGDWGYAYVSDVSYRYLLTSAGASENSPFIVVPDTNPGSFNWELQEISRRPWVNKTSDYTLTTLELKHDPIYTNDGAAGAVNLTHPAISEGEQKGGLRVVDAQYLKLTAPAGKTIRFGASQSAAAGYVRSNTVGNILEWEANADELVIISIIGTWYFDE